jgi:hypothetical protein
VQGKQPEAFPLLHSRHLAARFQPELEHLLTQPQELRRGGLGIARACNHAVDTRLDVGERRKRGGWL